MLGKLINNLISKRLVIIEDKGIVVKVVMIRTKMITNLLPHLSNAIPRMK
jgi:hypothetical protein